ncbi:MAG: hypothetical protein ABF479_12160 [Gluconacetobacter sp.]|uniref:Uncharacterized protein n=1 Tax=Gluconacetobacter dulcium TaxID=2729096 RepID=A0A7W4PI29_9PROT|nr:hypothetical protein [Gluconacetobacter dulcium]MBB2198832.1 hypothetical protein [Gluconacetobacter dulcium]
MSFGDQAAYLLTLLKHAEDERAATGFSVTRWLETTEESRQKWRDRAAQSLFHGRFDPYEDVLKEHLGIADALATSNRTVAGRCQAATLEMDQTIRQMSAAKDFDAGINDAFSLTERHLSQGQHEARRAQALANDANMRLANLG